ncbi:transmembrane and TPR repeat-containing protein 2 [Trichonephila clavipes]|nr:transmembrane and TPR repeat-containing protein 2 [Trichonephila clavipes]
MPAKFRQLCGKEVTSFINLGAMLHVNGKHKEAEGAYLEALKLRPNDPITKNNLQKLRNLIVPGLTNGRR